MARTVAWVVEYAAKGGIAFKYMSRNTSTAWRDTRKSLPESDGTY
jgi:hypothetical protein